MPVTIHQKCRFYRGSRPCTFNKLDGSECGDCRHVSLYDCRVLIIKLDALGDVLRTGCLLPFIAARHPRPYICWMTRPEAIELLGMMAGIDEVIPLNCDGLARVSTGSWDYVYSLSNDHTSAALAATAAPRHPTVGYALQDGLIQPSNDAAGRWLAMAAFDRLKRANDATYQALMLDILGVRGSFAPPRLGVPAELKRAAQERVRRLFRDSARKLVAVNVGAGRRWPKKMLEARQIASFVIEILRDGDVDVMLVGGQDETAKADAVLRACNHDRVRAALTPASVGQFAALLGEADVLLCGDTLALHLATALGLPTVCVVGPTSAAELADFDGLVVKTSVARLDCLGCYGDCAKVKNCMSLLSMPELIALTRRQLSRKAG